MKKALIRKIAILLAILTPMLVFAGILGKSHAKTTMAMEEFEALISAYSVLPDSVSYREYKSAFQEVFPSEEIIVSAADYVRYEEDGKKTTPQVFADYEGTKGGSVLTSENSLIEMEFQIAKEGFYNITLEYYPVAGKSADIERSVLIDGKLPYEELSLVSFHRIWKYDAPLDEMKNGVAAYKWTKDNQGNDNKPAMVEKPEWIRQYVYDSDGYVTEPLAVYLTQGTHEITLVSVREPMLLKSISFDNKKKLDTYAQVKAAQDAAGAKNSSGTLLIIEGENATKTSSQMLYPIQDQSSPSVSPSSPKELLNNTIGGNSWRLEGQWIEWEFEVPKDGYYYMSLYDRQSFSRGIQVSRRISIDGEVPFQEMSAYAFDYANHWREDVLKTAGGDPYAFYLTAGRHTLRMEVVLGDFSEVVSLVESSVRQLSAIYRQVIKVTGVNPDTYRDYQLAATLPNLRGELEMARDTLNEALVKLEKVAGKNSDKKAVLLTMRDQLDDLIKDEEYFVRTISSYKINVRALGNWITSVISQPLQIDRIFVYSPDAKKVIRKRGFFSGFGYEMARLVYSFTIDYNNIGSVSKEKDGRTITIWVGSGRDQANVIKALIDESFTRDTGISVNVQLVDMSTLLKASLVGEGPDVAIQVPNTNGVAGAVLFTGNDTPVNYGIRHAVLDLAQFDDLPEVQERFPESIRTQFCFDGATYALPETITYPVMFYRKDILAEIGLPIPETWEEVKVAMTVLAKNQMEFGMLANEQLFASLLYQNGGQYYNENATASALDSDVAVKTFKEFCEFYTDYKIDKETSVEERFRTGECPLMISDYTTYNNFAVSAPDIAGLWGFTQIPGTVKEDGSVDHSVACTGLATMIMSGTKSPDDAWEFAKWWTSAKTQASYGREMEGLMGSAARVPVANYEAFLQMPWPMEDFQTLKEAITWTRGIPQVPGGYYSWRNVYNAFYSVVTNSDKALPREELMDKIIYVNAEIGYKREELELDRADD